MPRITEVVKQLLILNILLFGATELWMPNLRYILSLYYPAAGDYFRPWQLVTHMFMHADFNHLLFNMFALYMFGSALESYWGGKRFLKFYFISGFGALALYLGVQYMEVSAFNELTYQAFLARPYPMMGASGAIFGLLAGFGMMFPNTRLMLLIPPIPMKAKYFVMIYAVIELIFGVSGIQTGVAHFAHLGGALFGALLIIYWRKTDEI
ncbi:MAG: rhomboid family intramembrane serine protease [Saprospiraceae bacterium]|nr:rhomboid family intramembrane serine protease [Saprospiraceae bacterium]